MAFKTKSHYNDPERQNRDFPGIEVVKKILKEDVLQYDERLSDPDSMTRFRIIPYWDEEIGVVDPLNPEGYPVKEGKSKPTWYDWRKAVSDWALVENVASFSTGNTYYQVSMYPSDKDRAGGTPPFDNFWRAFIQGMTELIDKEKKNLQQGLDSRLPEAWLNLWESTEGRRLFRWPQCRVFLQVLVKTVDNKGMEGEYTNHKLDGPGVLILPAEASKSFLKDIVHQEDKDQPLGPKNNRLGDFYTPDKGKMLKLKRSDSGGENTFPSYGVQLDSEPCVLGEKMIREMYRPWEDILDIRTPEDHMEWFLRVVDPDMVGAALTGTRWERYLPDTVRDRALNMLTGGANTKGSSGEKTDKEQTASGKETSGSGGKFKTSRQYDDPDEKKEPADTAREERETKPESAGKSAAPSVDEQDNSRYQEAKNKLAGLNLD